MNGNGLTMKILWKLLVNGNGLTMKIVCQLNRV